MHHLERIDPSVPFLPAIFLLIASIDTDILFQKTFQAGLHSKEKYLNKYQLAHKCNLAGNHDSRSSGAEVSHGESSNEVDGLTRKMNLN